MKSAASLCRTPISATYNIVQGLVASKQAVICRRLLDRTHGAATTSSWHRTFLISKFSEFTFQNHSFIQFGMVHQV